MSINAIKNTIKRMSSFSTPVAADAAAAAPPPLLCCSFGSARDQACVALEMMNKEVSTPAPLGAAPDFLLFESCFLVP